MVEFPLKQVEVGSWNPIILGKLLQLPAIFGRFPYNHPHVRGD